jgi:DNA-binding response OmpR family regulator
MHVLLIEPDLIQANIYKCALAEDGHTVDHTTTAQGAVYLADANRPDAVVLELQMANHNGVEFLYEFRSYPEWSNVPVLLHTFVPPAELRHAILTRELGVTHSLYKPETTLDSLRMAVRKMGPAIA